MLVIMLVLSALWLVLSRLVNMPTINPVAALLIPWIVVLTLASLPGVLANKLSQGTWTFVLLGIFSLTMGIFTGWLAPLGKSAARRFHPSGPVSELFKRTVTVWHYLLTVALVAWGAIQVSIVWPLVNQLGGLRAVFSTSGGTGGEYRHQYTKIRLEQIQGSFDSASILAGALGYVLFLGHISLFTGAILWVMGRRFAAVLPLIASASYSLFSLQRTSFFMAALLFVSSAYLVKKSGIVDISSKVGRRRISPVSAGAFVLAAAVLLYPLQQRNAGTSNSTGLLSVGQYVIASISGLNAKIDPSGYAVSMPLNDTPGTSAPFPGYGAYTFGGVFSILIRLGLPLSNAPRSLDYYWVNLFGQSSTTNTGSLFIDFYFDFGWIGIGAMSFILGLAAGLTYKMSLYGSIWILPAASFLFVATMWSFFGNSLLGDFRFIYMTFIACFFLHWLFHRTRVGVPHPRVRGNLEGAAVDSSLRSPTNLSSTTASS